MKMIVYYNHYHMPLYCKFLVLYLIILSADLYFQ